MSVYKIGSAVGAVGTVGGIGGTVVMANRETEPTQEQALKALSKEAGIKVSTVVSAIPGIGESKTKGKEADIKTKLNNKLKGKKTKTEVEKVDLKDLKDLKDLIEFEELKGEAAKDGRKNNFCEAVQKELFRRLAESEFKLEVEKKDTTEGFLDVIKACLTSEK